MCGILIIRTFVFLCFTLVLQPVKDILLIYEKIFNIQYLILLISTAFLTLLKHKCMEL